MTHALKTWPDYFNDVWVGYKGFELRQNDRNFKLGDLVLLQEYDPEKKEYTRREVKGLISYLLVDVQAFGLKEGYAIFQFDILSRIDSTGKMTT